MVVKWSQLSVHTLLYQLPRPLQGPWWSLCLYHRCVTLSGIKAIEYCGEYPMYFDRQYAMQFCRGTTAVSCSFRNAISHPANTRRPYDVHWTSVTYSGRPIDVLCLPGMAFGLAIIRCYIHLVEYCILSTSHVAIVILEEICINESFRLSAVMRYTLGRSSTNYCVVSI